MSDKPIYLLDANVILRLLRNDHTIHSESAAAIFKRAAHGGFRLQIDAVTASEVLYVCKALYKTERVSTAKALLRVLNSAGVSDANAPWLNDALERYSTTTIDAQDCFLAAHAKFAGKRITSFDRDFKKFPDVECISPEKLA